jgi:hypothetical protein
MTIAMIELIKKQEKKTLGHTDKIDNKDNY